MKVYLNRSQLARKLAIAPDTLVRRIKSKAIVPDAKDGKGRDLFDQERVLEGKKK